MTNSEMLRIVMEQCAVDSNCKPEDFLRSEPVFTRSVINEKARYDIKLPHPIDFVTFGGNVVVSCEDEFLKLAKEYTARFTPVYRLFETPNMQWLSDRIAEKNCRVCFMAEYFLPDLNILKLIECKYKTRVLMQSDFTELYTDEWSNALSFDRREKNVLGIGAYDADKLIGLAACSADAENMWQIGIDVLPEYRKNGIAKALTSRLALEILARGKVPFYCAAWSNIKSVRNAIASGFRPAWVEMTVKPKSLVDSFNGEADR